MGAVTVTKTLMRRLPLYLEYLRDLPDEEDTISATAIAAALGLGSVQVRKDLAKIAGEGRCRTGRSRQELIRNIEAFLENACGTASILIGAGPELEQWRFEDTGVHILACFDLHPTKKHACNGTPIYSIRRLESFCKYYDVHIGIIAVPTEQAQMVCDGLVACGVPAIWNLSPTHVTVPKGIRLQNISLSA